MERRERFEALAAEVVDPVRRYLARRTDPETAEDVLADTLLVCWRRLDEVPDPALPWVYAVARGCLANAARARRRQLRVAGRIARLDRPQGHVDGPDASRYRDDLDHDLREALAALRPDEAELLRLWAWEQLTPAEIAAVLDLTPNAVSIRLHRAKGRLRDRLRKDDAAAGHEPAEGR